MMLVIFCLIGRSGSSQIAAWDFTGQDNVPTVTATTFNSNLISVGGANNITRGIGAKESAGGNSFRTSGFKNDGISVSNTDYFQITLSPVAGQTLSLSKIDANVAGTATFAANPGVYNQFAYSLDGNNFKLISNPTVIIGTPKIIPQNDLSVIQELQNISSGITVTIRYYASGQTTTGGWGFFSSATGVNGLSIGGSFTPSLSKLSFVAVPVTGTTNQSLSTFSVEVRKYDNTLDNNFSGNITLTKASGPGTVNGTLSAAAISGVATFNDVSFNQPGNYTLSAVGNSTTPATSGTITISESSFATDYFRSNINAGDWQSLSSWQASHDNINWFSSTIIPGNLSRGISIRNGHTIKLTNVVTAKLLTIESGGTLTNTNVSSGYLLTVEDDGTAASDFNIYGTYVLFGKIPAFNNGAIATVFANGLVRADENTGSEYFASSTNVSFKTGAVFEWNNYNVFNTQQVIYFPNAISEVPIFRISKTTPALGSTKDNTFNGILEINSNVAFTGTGDKIFRDGLTGIGILKVASSTARYFITSSTGIIGGTLKIETNNILRFPNGILIPNGSNVSVTGTGSLKNDGGNFKIDGILDISDVKLTLTIGSLILNGTIKTSKNTGFFNPGNISSGVIKINDASTIEYNGADQDITSSTVLKSSYYNIVFSGTGKKIPISGIDVHTNGSVKITGQAIVDASAKNIGSSGLDATSFIMDGGRLILGTSSNEALPLMDGPYNITGGVIEYNYSGTTITQTIKTKTYQNIEVTGSNVGNSSGNITLNSGGTFTVKSNGVFEINANSITSPSGGATVTVETGGFFKTGNNQGFHGFATTPDLQYSSIHSNISDIRLMPGSTIEYMRKGDQPITTANELIYSNIFLSGSGNKVAPKGDLKILGNIVKSGTSIFDANNGSVILNGTSDQSISGGMMLFNNFTNINMTGLNINNDIGVYKSLLLGLNSTTILNTGDIHLKSDNYNTANVAQVPASAKIKYNAGRFIVERYIPKHSKAWQLLSAPAKGETIKNTWQESNNPGGNIKPGYGTQITSNIPDATNLGFDLNSIGPSMKTYNSLTNQWDGVANTKDLLINNLSGYMIFIRGDRSVTDVNQAAVATTLRTRGKLYSPGNEAPLPVNTIANTFASIGNPYASAINFENINLSEGIDHSYYIWDPELNTSGFSAYGFGGYRTISGNSVVPATGKFSDENNLPMIQSGQAFLIHSSKSGTVIFDESCKIPGSTSIFRATGLVKPNAQLRANLLVLNSNESILLDGILTQFHTDYLNELDKWDAFKITNSNENMAISTQGNSIAIERRQRPEINDTIFYHLEHLLKKPYRIEFIANNLEKYGIELFLEDKYLQTKSQLNPTGITNIDFSVNSIAGSFDKERFQVIFKAAGGPLPITFHSLNVFLKSNNIMVEWSVENEMNIDHYEVEKSSDGNLFFSVNSQFSKNISASNYDWLDEKPFEGYNYYRIKSVGKNGKVEYSAIVPVNAGIKKSSIVVYNNPLINGKIALQFVSQPFGKYLVKLFTTSGQRVLSKEINHNGGSRSEIISLPHNAAHGIYLLKITKPSGKMVIIKIIK